MRLLKFFIPVIILCFFNIPAFAQEEISGKAIKIHYEKKNETLANYILQISNEVRQSVSSKTGINYDENILVKIAPNRNEFNKITGIDNLAIQGIAVSEMNLTVINAQNFFQKSNNDIFKLLEHELAHIYMGNYINHHSDIAFPRWLNEGLAQWISDGSNELFSSSFQDSLQAAFLSNKILPFSSIISGFPITQDDFTLAYAQSLSMVEYLSEKYGNEKIKELIAKLKEDKNFYIAFSNVYPLPFTEVEKNWQNEKRENNYTFDYYFSTHIDVFISGLIVVSAFLAFLINFLKNRKIKKQYALLDENNDF